MEYKATINTQFKQGGIPNSLDSLTVTDVIISQLKSWSTTNQQAITHTPNNIMTETHSRNQDIRCLCVEMSGRIVNKNLEPTSETAINTLFKQGGFPII